MRVYTLNVGQGNFNVVVGDSEAFIVDTYVPVNSEQNIVNVKSALSTILAGKNLVGLIITGFDADHFNEVGLKIVLNKYRPNWIMYPRYFKPTANAEECFKVIDQFDRSKSITRHSILLNNNATRFYNNLSNNFSFEIFSPHSGDMTCSNNCSLVCKVIEKASSQSYLITGDTEIERWDNIINSFGKGLGSHLMAAPHHGSRNAVTTKLLEQISPHTVVISAGVNNRFGHPHSEAITLYVRHAKACYQTNVGPDGICIETVLETGQEPISYKFNPIS